MYALKELYPDAKTWNNKIIPELHSLIKEY